MKTQHLFRTCRCIGVALPLTVAALAFCSSALADDDSLASAYNPSLTFNDGGPPSGNQSPTGNGSKGSNTNAGGSQTSNPPNQNPKKQPVKPCQPHGGFVGMLQGAANALGTEPCIPNK